MNETWIVNELPRVNQKLNSERKVENQKSDRKLNIEWKMESERKLYI